jgi:hypothetical protein
MICPINFWPVNFSLSLIGCYQLPLVQGDKLKFIVQLLDIAQ